MVFSIAVSGVAPASINVPRLRAPGYVGMELGKQKGEGARAARYCLDVPRGTAARAPSAYFPLQHPPVEPDMPLILVLGPALDLLFIALLSRHRTFWLALAVTVACGLSLFGDLAGNGVITAAPLLGGSR
jgi:hypothetical protein